MNERKNQQDELGTKPLQSSSAPADLHSHEDLEHTHPTDSRADEKVIVNHRPGFDPSFEKMDNRTER